MYMLMSVLVCHYVPRTLMQLFSIGDDIVPMYLYPSPQSHRHSTSGPFALLSQRLFGFALRGVCSSPFTLLSAHYLFNFIHRGQRWSASTTAEPLYFKFPSTDALNTWMALLRSYATAEVYGSGIGSSDGGLYRMWRQVELTCIQGRNIGIPRAFSENLPVPSQLDSEARSDSDIVDLDLFCEVYFNQVLSARTVVKKGFGHPDWHEKFTFTDLPPFERLAIVLLRERKMLKPLVLGTVYIT